MIDTILKSVTGVVGEFIEDKDKKNENGNLVKLGESKLKL